MRLTARRTWLLAALGAAVLPGCANVPPPLPAPVADDCGPGTDLRVPLLRLSPASLERTLAVQQQLTVTAQGQTRRVDVLLEADATSVRLALVSMGQTAARLVWDGTRLDETRASWLPAAVSGERILSDLQLALWPGPAIDNALPAGWFLDVLPTGRVLRQLRTTVTTVAYPSPDRIELAQLRDGYRIVIETRDLR